MPSTQYLATNNKEQATNNEQQATNNKERTRYYVPCITNQKPGSSTIVTLSEEQHPVPST